MISNNEGRSFIAHVIGLDGVDVLTDSVSWIADNLQPDEVFSDEALREWASENGLIEDPE